MVDIGMNQQVITVFYTVFGLVAFVSCGYGNGLRQSDRDELTQYLQDQAAAQHIPALSTLAFRKNQIIYESYIGKSHIGQNVDLQKDHLFLLASISKTITATALLQLYEQGKFSLDDKINDYLPFDVKVPGQTRGITFKMLLTHTSAIADGSAMDGQYYDGVDSPIALDFFLENYLVPGGGFYNANENFHDFKPGAQHEYSNEGSALLAVLVEQISKKNFNTYCKENIFKPLGMMHTFWRLDEIAQTNYRITQPYNYTNESYEVVEHYTFTDYPNGGLRSTVTDLFYFLRAFVLGGTSNGYQLLKVNTISMMHTLQIPSLDNEMGFHMFRIDGANNLWGHDGGEEGVSTIMAFNPTTKTGVIILGNMTDVEMDSMLIKAYQIGMRFQTNDPDGDGVTNDIDLDDDNDGILDSKEGASDTDGDQIPDSQDLDSDNDGISDLIESGNPNISDTNNDGMADGVADITGLIAGSSAIVINTDGRGLPDYLDVDSDEDGIHDIVENGYGRMDSNGDGEIDAVIDGDDDGLADRLDAVDSIFGFFPGATPGCKAAGLSNSNDLLNYAFGDHVSAQGAYLNVVGNEVSLVRRAGRYDVNYTIERSDDLSKWNTITLGVPSVIDHGKGTSTWTWSGVPIAVAPANRGFIRVLVSTPCSNP